MITPLQVTKDNISTVMTQASKKVQTRYKKIERKIVAVNGSYFMVRGKYDLTTYYDIYRVYYDQSTQRTRFLPVLVECRTACLLTQLRIAEAQHRTLTHIESGMAFDLDKLKIIDIVNDYADYLRMINNGFNIAQCKYSAYNNPFNKNRIAQTGYYA